MGYISVLNLFLFRESLREYPKQSDFVNLTTFPIYYFCECSLKQHSYTNTYYRIQFQDDNADNDVSPSQMEEDGAQVMYLTSKSTLVL